MSSSLPGAKSASWSEKLSTELMERDRLTASKIVISLTRKLRLAVNTLRLCGKSTPEWH